MHVPCIYALRLPSGFLGQGLAFFSEDRLATLLVLNLYEHTKTLGSFPSFCRTPFLPNITESKMGYWSELACCDITTLLVMFQLTFIEPLKLFRRTLGYGFDRTQVKNHWSMTTDTSLLICFFVFYVIQVTKLIWLWLIQSRVVHGLDFRFFGSGLRLLSTGSGVKLSFLQPDPGWILFLLKQRYWLFVWLIFIRTQTGVGLLESSWYRIWIGLGFTICNTGLEPDSKNQSPNTSNPVPFLKSESEISYLRHQICCFQTNFWCLIFWQ